MSFMLSIATQKLLIAIFLVWQNVNPGRANDGTPDTEVDDIVTLLAGFKQPSK